MKGEDGGNSLYVVKDAKRKTVYDYVLEYLEGKYDILYNEISHDFQIASKGNKDWSYLNMNSRLIELAKAGIDVTTAKLEILIRSELIKRYNPIAEYFRSLPPWDGTDHISRFASYVLLYEPEVFLYHFRKWLVRAIKCALEPGYFNKQCLVICHHGQSSGKSTWCRFLCPPELWEYMAEDINTDKDARIPTIRRSIKF